MMATIAHFRGNKTMKKGNQMILHVDGVTTKEEAEKLVGKKVTWTSPGKEKKVITGKISGAHGNSGAVRALFERGLPGQALGEEAQVE